MSNIDKALRSTSERDWFEDWFKREFHPDKTGPYIKDQLFFAVRAARTPLLDELEAKDKQIAELEAREVVLPSTQDVHPLGPQSAKIFCEFHRSIVNRCADEIRKVGVKVSIKGN
ncbi:ead/Ea22-like family protein [Enterobacter hormaechei]